MIGVGVPTIRSVACMYAVTPDGGFMVDETSPGAFVASACSGHGFKHSAGLGEALAERARGVGGEGSRSSLAALLDGSARWRWGTAFILDWVGGSGRLAPFVL
ncbi:hypothetical protein ACHAXA_005409 [Cyclostephanos tholiformis]|uniref:FAD dependent oxidoreductase domain-containing protein n=1 Tax=Cyclostephanos tholiformis TaxID=382380 RepID=A0ABD3RE74_9STRA